MKRVLLIAVSVAGLMMAGALAAAEPPDKAEVVKAPGYDVATPAAPMVFELAGGPVPDPAAPFGFGLVLPGASAGSPAMPAQWLQQLRQPASPLVPQRMSDAGRALDPPDPHLRS